MSVSKPKAYLHLVVILLQLSAELLQFLLETDILAQFGTIRISLLLQGITSFLVALVFLFQSSHICKEFTRSLGEVVNLLHIVHLGNLL